MEQNLELQKLAAEVATNLITETTKTLSSTLAHAFDRTKAAIHAGMTSYYDSVLLRTAYIKTLVHPREMTLIDKIYIAPQFDNYTDQMVISEITKGGKVAIIGTAGSGKSMFLKYTSLRLLRTRKPPFPIFFELKTLNQTPDTPLIESLRLSIADHAPHIDRSIFESQLKHSKYILILDGLDEITHSQRSRRAAEINSIITRFPGLSILVSSRPEENERALISFKEVSPLPLTMQEACTLIRKMEFERVEKSEFINQLQRGLFFKYKEFLSNPLLLTMMLLTFSQRGGNFMQITTFYRQAYEVLFSRHDWNKGVFTRTHYSNLDIESFSRVFSAFCAYTYAGERFEFSETEALEYIREALKFEDISENDRYILLDLIESTSLIQRDGIILTFVHRTFQEYFCACFLIKRPDDEARDAFDTILSRASTDRAFDMALEMEPLMFERSWVLPTCESLIDFLDIKNPKPISFILSRIFHKAKTDKKYVVKFINDQPTDMFMRLSVLRRMYKREMLQSFYKESYYFSRSVDTYHESEIVLFSDVIKKYEYDDDVALFLNKIASYHPGYDPYLVDVISIPDNVLKEMGVDAMICSLRDDIYCISREVSERLAGKRRSFRQIFSKRTAW